VKYGLYLPNFGAFGRAAAVADLAVDAEAAGWDGFFIWDHINRGFATEVVDPWIALAAVAARTRRLRIGALVTPLARRRPWKVARETVSLDHLSSGRLVFGAGLGSARGGRSEWASFGEELDPKTRAGMLDEGLDVLTGLWSGRDFSYEGKHYTVGTTPFTPAALQTPRIPVWVAGIWPNRAPFRRAARWDGMFPLFGATEATPEQMREAVEFTLEQRAEDADFDVVHLGQHTEGSDPARAAESVAPFAAAGVTWWLERIAPDEFGGAWEGDWPLEAMRERVMQGPPAALA